MRYLKLIWFAEDPWTKYHAAVGVNAQKTLCGVYRSTRAILPSEKLKAPHRMRVCRCLNCLATLRKHYGGEDIERVKI